MLMSYSLSFSTQALFKDALLMDVKRLELISGKNMLGPVLKNFEAGNASS